MKYIYITSTLIQYNLPTSEILIVHNADKENFLCGWGFLWRDS